MSSSRGNAQANRVEVSEDYLVFLHDELAENQKMLKELLGESQSRAIFSLSADRLITTVGSGRYASDPLEGIVKKLTSWGMQVAVKTKGTTTEVEIKCPYAERVHPRLSSEEPTCPLEEYILGAVRLEDSKSQILHHKLTNDGVKLAIERKD